MLMTCCSRCSCLRYTMTPWRGTASHGGCCCLKTQSELTKSSSPKCLKSFDTAMSWYGWMLLDTATCWYESMSLDSPKCCYEMLRCCCQRTMYRGSTNLTEKLNLCWQSSLSQLVHDSTLNCW